MFQCFFQKRYLLIISLLTKVFLCYNDGVFAVCMVLAVCGFGADSHANINSLLKVGHLYCIIGFQII